jgi:hypothetical protein
MHEASVQDMQWKKIKWNEAEIQAITLKIWFFTHH